MPAVQETVWEATPHTLAKIVILKNYLQAWFRILGGSGRNESLLFVDGFAGPGRYACGAEGSPIASLKAANNALFSMGSTFSADHIHCVFIEKDADRFAELSKSVAAVSLHAKLRVEQHHCEFVDGIAKMESSNPSIFRSKAPTLVFADPFGLGISFSTLANCMKGASSELLINLDVDGIARIFLARSNNNRESQLTDLFGDSSWKNEFDTGGDLKKITVQILSLYKKRLLSVPGVKFVWSFAMRGKHDSINYHLVFATKHPRGQQKMKEAMRTIDKSGSYSFSDAHSDQHVLFGDSDETFYAERLFQAYTGKVATMDEIAVFALNETPFMNAKRMLAHLESENRIQVKAANNYERRRGTFPDDKVESIAFGNFGALLKQPQLL